TTTTTHASTHFPDTTHFRSDALRPTIANVGLAQALYDTTPENGTIPAQYFREVAALLKWATGAN
ncbi:EscU/YscU/HrcU family type III secretion system export apparatus switch protein, partial [Paraburkholderia sp. Se-20369]|nr:EscU/YscU/HrcU family type III secretion system export apparatus switch protein [Paraburkholderia sp. Se-20369]